MVETIKVSMLESSFGLPADEGESLAREEDQDFLDFPSPTFSLVGGTVRLGLNLHTFTSIYSVIYINIYIYIIIYIYI